MGNLNPYYNESFVFIVEQEQLRVITTLLFFLVWKRKQPGIFFFSLLFYNKSFFFDQKMLARLDLSMIGITRILINNFLAFVKKDEFP